MKEKLLQNSKLNTIAFGLVCAVVVLTTLAYGTVHQPIIAVFYVSVAILLALWAVDAFVCDEASVNRSYLQIPIYGASIYGLIQVIPFGSIAETAGVSGIPRTISLDPFATQVNALHFLALGILFSVTLVLLNSAARIRKLAGLITIFGFAYAFFAILQSVLSPDKIYGIYEAKFASPFGSFVSRHNFAAYMEMSLAVPIGLIFVGAIKRDKRLLYFTAVGLMGVALLLSGSRGGLVSVAAEVILLVILTTKGSDGRSKLLRIVLVAALGAAIVLGSFFVGGDTSLSRIADTATSDDITTDRSHIWEVTTKVIAGHLPFGAGLGGYGVAYTKYDDRSGLERVEQAHNDYLQVLSDAGLIGVLLGGFFVFWLVRTGRRVSRVENVYRRAVATGAFAGCCGVLVHSIFDFVLHTTAISVLFIMLMSLLVSCRSSYADDIDDGERDGRRHRRSHR